MGDVVQFKLSSKDIRRFMDLFSGYEDAFGTYTIKSKEDNGKFKGQAITHKKAATELDFEKHLSGAGPGIGIIPLRGDNTITFATLDIDINNIDHKKLEKLIKSKGYPLVLCRSKSGGAHAILFTRDPVEAHTIRERLADWAADLGYGGCEVFPKQSARANPEDYGNWINLPYFNVNKSDRACLHNGTWISFSQFLDVAEKARVKFDTIKTRKKPKPDNKDPYFEAPPCLVHLSDNGGFPDNTRNKGLFAIAVYLKKRYPDDWETHLSERNRLMCSPPLAQSEVNEIIKSAKRKEDSYPCADAPIAAHCNKRECLQREYGIGESSSGCAEIGGVTRYVTAPGDPVKWGLEVAGRRVHVDNEILYNRDLFNRYCMGELSIIPVSISQAEWLKKLNAIISTSDTIQLPPDAGPSGILWEHIEMFLLQKAQAKTIDEVWTGRPFKEHSVIWFRSVDLFSYLDQRHLDYGGSKQNVWGLLKERGGKSEGKKIGGKFINLWQLPEPKAPESGRTDTKRKENKEEF